MATESSFARRLVRRAASGLPMGASLGERRLGVSRGTMSALLLVAVLAYSVAAVAVYTERARTLDEGRATAARLAALLEEQTLRTSRPSI